MSRPITRLAVYFVLSALLAAGLPGCALLAKKPSAGADLKGSVDDNIYTSPGNSFRVRLPFLARDASVVDEIPTRYTVLVTISDSLCREFFISQRPGYLGTESLESWVNTHIVADLQRSGLAVKTQTLTTRNGPAVKLRYRAKAAAPCSRTITTEGKPVVTKLDADVGWYVYHRDGRFYRLLYVIGIGPEAPSLWYVNREPVDEVLDQFAEGFEIVDGKEPPTP
jgi:hypothetical protein